MSTPHSTDPELYFWFITFTGTSQTGVLRTDGQGGVLLLAGDGTFIPVDVGSLPAFACERISYFAGEPDREEVTS